MAGGGLVAVVVRNQTQMCWQNPSAQSPSSLRGAGCLICDGVSMGYRGEPSLHAAFGQKGRLCVLRTAWPCHFPSPCAEFDHAAAVRCWTRSKDLSPICKDTFRVCKSCKSVLRALPTASAQHLCAPSMGISREANSQSCCLEIRSPQSPHSWP